MTNEELERKAENCFMRITSFSPREELGGIERKWIINCIYKELKQLTNHYQTTKR